MALSILRKVKIRKPDPLRELQALAERDARKRALREIALLLPPLDEPPGCPYCEGRHEREHHCEEEMLCVPDDRNDPGIPKY